MPTRLRHFSSLYIKPLGNFSRTALSFGQRGGSVCVLHTGYPKYIPISRCVHNFFIFLSFTTLQTVVFLEEVPYDVGRSVVDFADCRETDRRFP